MIINISHLAIRSLGVGQSVILPGKIDEHTTPRVILQLQNKSYRLFRCYPRQKPTHIPPTKNLIHLELELLEVFST